MRRCKFLSFELNRQIRRAGEKDDNPAKGRLKDFISTAIQKQGPVLLQVIS